MICIHRKAERMNHKKYFHREKGKGISEKMSIIIIITQDSYRLRFYSEMELLLIMII